MHAWLLRSREYRYDKVNSMQRNQVRLHKTWSIRYITRIVPSGAEGKGKRGYEGMTQRLLTHTLKQPNIEATRQGVAIAGHSAMTT
jgi:hypothetical protein